MQIPYSILVDTQTAFGHNEHETMLFLREHFPNLNTGTGLTQRKLLEHFQLIKLKKGEIVINETEWHEDKTSFIYLIAEGEVRIEVAHNPIQRMAM